MYRLYILYMTAAHFDTLSAARAHLKDVLDAAEAGAPVTMARGGLRAGVVDADRLRETLAVARPAHAEVVAEAGGWTVALPGLPLAADGSTLEAALGEMIAALREYAADWVDHLRVAPNHRDNWALVQLIGLSDDAQLHAWLVGE